MSLFLVRILCKISTDTEPQHTTTTTTATSRPPKNTLNKWPEFQSSRLASGWFVLGSADDGWVRNQDLDQEMTLGG